MFNPQIIVARIKKWYNYIIANKTAQIKRWAVDRVSAKGRRRSIALTGERGSASGWRSNL